MQLCVYRDEDWKAVPALFNRVLGRRCRLLMPATSRGLVRDRLQGLVETTRASKAWTVRDGDAVVGFVSAHATGSGNGLITTPVCDDLWDAGVRMLNAAEDFLRQNGVAKVKVVGVSREYGVGFGDRTHTWLLNRGYTSSDTHRLEYVMENDLTQFQVAPAVDDLRGKNEADGLVFEFLQADHIESLKEFAPEWAQRQLANPFGAHPVRYPYAVCRDGEAVVGFCGGCHVEPEYGSGGWNYLLLRGYTRERDGQYFGRGIGAVLLGMSNTWLKDHGARFQVIVTGVANPTQRLYRKAGYRYCFVKTVDIQKQFVDS